MVLFWKNCERLKAVNYFQRKAPSQTFNQFLNTLLYYITPKLIYYIKIKARTWQSVESVECLQTPCDLFLVNFKTTAVKFHQEIVLLRCYKDILLKKIDNKIGGKKYKTAIKAKVANLLGSGEKL